MEQIINRILQEIDYTNNPYFVSLHKGEFEKNDFVETQIQFFFAVIFFNRPMSALAAKIPDPALRLEILRNIWEEHGEGDLNKAHSNTFIEFLSRIGNIHLEEVYKKALWPEIRIFNTCLTGACVLDDFMVGVAMMGMIERIFCDISTIIGNGIIKNGWLTQDSLIHYDLHAELDVKHSQDFFDVIKPLWGKNAENKYYIEQGLYLGATLFNNLYKELYLNRKRRITREYLGPHSRAEGII